MDMNLVEDYQNENEDFYENDADIQSRKQIEQAALIV